MTEQAKQSASSKDLLEKEYHDIGIQAIAGACCVKKHNAQKHTDYDPCVKHG